MFLLFLPNKLLLLALAASCSTSHATDDDWQVKKLRFSAISIGITMESHTTGWTSVAFGQGGTTVQKTTDGGETWAPVKNQSKASVIMGLDSLVSRLFSYSAPALLLTTCEPLYDRFCGLESVTVRGSARRRCPFTVNYGKSF